MKLRALLKLTTLIRKMNRKQLLLTRMSNIKSKTLNQKIKKTISNVRIILNQNSRIPKPSLTSRIWKLNLSSKTQRFSQINKIQRSNLKRRRTKKKKSSKKQRLRLRRNLKAETNSLAHNLKLQLLNH